MASVDFQKMHTAGEVKAVIAHCDKSKRMEHEHANHDINRDMTKSNLQGKNSDYATACKAFDDKIAYLDSLPGANKRKDRVIAFGLDIPRPKDLPADKCNDWFKKAVNIVGDQYGRQNIIGFYLHKDEIHEYTHFFTGEKDISREHLHVLVVPEHNNKLNGKWFSSKSNMIKLNESIHEMSKSDYGVDFMDGTGRKGPRVNVCKRESAKREIEQLKAEKEALLQAVRDAEDQVLRTAAMIQADRDLKAARQERYEEQADDLVSKTVKGGKHDGKHPPVDSDYEK